MQHNEESYQLARLYLERTRTVKGYLLYHANSIIISSIIILILTTGCHYLHDSRASDDTTPVQTVQPE